MRLKYVEIQGFKSFPDKTKLSFKQDMTAVIGPNGSGKSNISDAIRWVLGEQSNKSLRGQKMEDVIFGGTANRRQMGFAETMLTFDNCDRRLNFDSDEITITRRLYRSGDSEYRINNAAVRLKDINELFMDTGLGRDGYSIIGQGKIDEIVSSKSNERREIFEEAAGISRYKYRKVEAQRRLEQAQENLIRILDIKNELEGRVAPLKEQSEKALQFIELSNKKHDLEIGLWLNTLNNSGELLREQDYKITLSKSQYEKVEKDITEIEAQYEINAGDAQRISVQLDTIRRESAKAEEQAASLKGEVAVLENTIYHNNGTIERLNREINTTSSDDLTIDSQINENVENINSLQQQLDEKNKKLNEILTMLNSLADNSGEFSKQIEDNNRKLNDLSAKIADFRVQSVTAQTSKNETLLSLNNINDSVNQLQGAFSKLREETTLIEEDLKRIDQQSIECENAVSGYQIKEQSRKQKLEDKQQQISKLQLDLGETKRRIKILQELEQNMDGYSYAVKAVSKQASMGALRGVHGPVSKIINVPDKYAVAIETALGAAAQFIVTSNEDDAKRAIEFLKTNNFGRATFLPLTSIKSNQLKQSFDGCVGYVNVAEKLVEYNNKYSEIIGYLLGRCIISEDIDSAVAIAKKSGYRFKVVTLDGQVVNAGGSLTGGSNAKNTGLLSRTGKIESLKAKAEKLDGSLQQNEQSLKEIREDYTKINAELEAAKSELTTNNEDKIRVLAELRRLNEQQKSTTLQIDRLQTQHDEFEVKIKKFNELYEHSEVGLKDTQNEYSQVQISLAELTGGRDKLSENRNQLTEEMSAFKLEIIGIEKDLENLKLTIKQLQTSKLDKAKRADELKAEINEIDEKNNGLLKEIEKLNQINVGFLQNSNDSKADIEQLIAKRTQLEQQSVKIREREKELTSVKEKLSSSLARLCERKQVMESEYYEIEKKLFDEYELTKNQAEQLSINIDDAQKSSKQLKEIRNVIRSLGSVNVAAIEEYKEVSQRYEFLVAQIEDIEKSKNELYKLIDKLTKTMKDMFIEKFSIINQNFSEIFQQLFSGGSAQLKLIDENNILESGIDIIAQPPGKNISIIEQLSGGEKALIAVSIYFAIIQVNPPPFCLLDEVEAALDDVNVDKVATYLRKLSKQTQFIIITHRRGTMEEADVLYGVTMQEKGVSKLLSIDVSEIETAMQPIKV